MGIKVTKLLQVFCGGSSVENTDDPFLAGRDYPAIREHLQACDIMGMASNLLTRPVSIIILHKDANGPIVTSGNYPSIGKRLKTVDRIDMP